MLNLLIVDDEPIIRDGLRHMIRSVPGLAADVRTAADGFEALHVLETFHPDLLLTDIQMPEMDGFQLIREARKRRVERCAVLTGYDEFAYAQQAIRLHVLDYLLKPIRQDELSALLRQTAEEVAARKTAERLASGCEAPGSEAPGDAAPGDAASGGLAAVQPATVASGRASGPDGRDDGGHVKKFKAYVNRHFMRDISLEEVAGHLGLHPNYVCSLLKREMGMTFVQYVHQVRIEHAKRLLVGEIGLPLELVARRSGFENPRYFYKVFKNLTGRTPGRFRSEQLGGNADDPADDHADVHADGYADGYANSYADDHQIR